MAWDKTPTALIASWSEDGTNVTFPIASIPQLTDAEADATTGDSRKILLALNERFYVWYSALAAADQPDHLSVVRSISDNGDGTAWLTYVHRIKVDLTGLTMEVTDEPA